MFENIFGRKSERPDNDNGKKAAGETAEEYIKQLKESKYFGEKPEYEDVYPMVKVDGEEGENEKAA